MKWSIQGLRRVEEKFICSHLGFSVSGKQFIDDMKTRRKIILSHFPNYRTSKCTQKQDLNLSLS